ncbi:hypothetical protein JAAARDRAFT_33271 [Jaapia argillacea MUCL 33604]|uniref:Glyoxalase-like domain-containing protein n=1 Tax=Jaapia argillacea MUCL 33604 TaxID=933084 RepID=A0A067PYA4_9AGAM|nr:hypothetical protein JAAARDRAFT_33271 [Jaapia argillacea MUCL 33604]
MSVPSTKILDHIVHLTPPGSLEATSAQWRELGFKVIPGGKHAGGFTANALVILQDGAYIELIYFTHPLSYYPPGSPERKARETHYWASKAPGWIDFAFLGTSPTLSEVINERAEREGSGVKYLSEQEGGRERPDGKVLKWLITAPAPEDARGRWPFFCGDVSPREWRVPVDPPSNAEHPCKALGLAHVRLLAEEQGFSILSNQVTSIIGARPIESSASEAKWVLDSPNISSSPPYLILSKAKTEVELDYLRTGGAGIYEVGFLVPQGSGRHGSAETPFGRIVWVEEYSLSSE